ncbi:hypothetical protein [Yoonia litorea]|uniref:Uncharacterized protein n=1 Tax=Yoonia litorea TaxID=1123755 RepID=A0A1I6MVH3_9RHOB|nr:hypothetical protein [Yoonia litorea]SFS19538.1 hypothetical protein SAMN05444714_2231 [Yoonia litorea]
MLKLDQSLPDGALLGGARETFASQLQRTGAVWLHGDRESFEVDDETGAIQKWQSIDGHKTATPAEPNEGNGRLFKSEALVGLQCIPETNCGLVVPNITENAGTFSMAVLYRPAPDGQSKTLVTVNTGYSGGSDADSNYVFLSDAGDFFTAKDTRGAVEVLAPVTSPSDRVRMAIVTLSGNTLAVAENLSTPVVAHGADAGMRTEADLFIGCRSNRSGLKKTLGGATVLDVLFWPKHALLIPRGAEDAKAYTDLKRYFLWEH